MTLFDVRRLIEGYEIMTKEPVTKEKRSLLSGEYREIPLRLIDPPQKPVRGVAAEIVEDLAVSVNNDGLYAPVIVRPAKSGRFEVVAGNHRFHAIVQNYRAKQGTAPPKVPCIVRSLSDGEAQLVSVAENVQRNNVLDAITEGEVFNARVKEGWTPEQIMERIGKKQLPYVTNRMLIAEKLHPALQIKVRYARLNVLDAVRIAGYPLKDQIPEFKRMSVNKHGAVDQGEKCTHRCPRHCPGAIAKNV
jgi:ParB/RepB/Spo0J family partition protein